MSDHEHADAGQILSFMTTEHFNLQTERASATAEVNGRLQLYMSTLSASLITLALAAQLSDAGEGFRVFALVLLPTVFVFGLVTIGRIGQAWVAWFTATQGMGRIRHYYTEIAPEMEPYFMMPTTDDPRHVLAGSGIGDRAPGWVQGLYTAPAAIAILNSIVAGVFVGLLSSIVVDGSMIANGILGALGAVLCFVTKVAFGRKAFLRRLGAVESRFPPAGHTERENRPPAS